MRIALLRPLYGWRPWEADQAGENAVMALRDIHEIASITTGNTYIHEARTKLARELLIQHKQKNFDWIMHIDSDMVFHANDVIRLIKHAAENKFDILSGIYFTKHPNKILPLVFNKVEACGSKDSYQYYEKLPEKDFFEADALGFGFLLCRPKVYLDLHEKHGNFMFDYRRSEWGQNCGEDIVWCERARELGYKIMVDRKVIVGHAGGVVGFREHKAYLAEQEAKRKLLLKRRRISHE